jgi:hypothetical protein
MNIEKDLEELINYRLKFNASQKEAFDKFRKEFEPELIKCLSCSPASVTFVSSEETAGHRLNIEYLLPHYNLKNPLKYFVVFTRGTNEIISQIIHGVGPSWLSFNDNQIQDAAQSVANAIYKAAVDTIYFSRILHYGSWRNGICT